MHLHPRGRDDRKMPGAFLRELCRELAEMMRGGNAFSGYAVTSTSQSSTGFPKRLWFRLSLSYRSGDHSLLSEVT